MNAVDRTSLRRGGLWAVLIVAGALGPATLPADTVRIEQDGKVLRGYYTPAPDGAPTVLMLHGTLAHAEMEIMSTFRDVFAEEGWGALAVSLSLGESEREGMYPCESVHRHLATDATRELSAWRAWLGDQGVDRIVLLGHSRGALQMAAYAAALDDPTVAALILVAPPAGDDASRAGAYGERFGDALDVRLAEARARVEAGQGDAPIEGVGFLYCEDATVTAASFLSYYGEAAPAAVAPLIDASPYPVLVVAGSEDTISRGLDAVLGDAVRRPGRALVEIEGADHFFRDLYAYDVVEAVQGFVGEEGAP
jgi:pimeloyl-ACP methyl ester carboxylesterase